LAQAAVAFFLAGGDQPVIPAQAGIHAEAKQSVRRTRHAVSAVTTLAAQYGFPPARE